MTVYPRLRMRLSLVEREVAGPWRVRRIDASDVPALGALMLAAYRGTVDDEGETEADAIAEIDRISQASTDRCSRARPSPSTMAAGPSAHR